MSNARQLVDMRGVLAGNSIRCDTIITVEGSHGSHSLLHKPHVARYARNSYSTEITYAS